MRIMWSSSTMNMARHQNFGYFVGSTEVSQDVKGREMRGIRSVIGLLAILLIAMVTEAGAIDVMGLNLKFAKGINPMDAIGLARSSGSSENPDARGMVAGISSGSLIGLHDADGTKPISFIGFTMYASSSLEGEGGVDWIPTFNPILFFDDSIHVDVGKNLNGKGITIGLGVSGVEVIKLLGRGAATAIGGRIGGGP